MPMIAETVSPADRRVRDADHGDQPVVDQRVDALADGGLGDLQPAGDLGVAEPAVLLEEPDDPPVEGVGPAARLLLGRAGAATPGASWRRRSDDSRSVSCRSGNDTNIDAVSATHALTSDSAGAGLSAVRHSAPQHRENIRGRTDAQRQRGPAPTRRRPACATSSARTPTSTASPSRSACRVGHFADAAGGSELYTVGALEGMGKLGPNEDECSGPPDLDAVTVLPWDPRYAIAPVNLYLRGEPYPFDYRRLLQDQVAAAAALGFRCDFGVEPEVYVLRRDARRLRPVRARGRRQRGDPRVRRLHDDARRPVPGTDRRPHRRARLGPLLVRPRGRRRAVRVRLRLRRRGDDRRPHGRCSG